MNIELQCCGLAILVILLLLFFREKNLDFSSRRLFLLTIISCLVCLSLDILSIVGIDAAQRGVIPPLLARFICKVYVVSLVHQCYRGFLYAAGEFFAEGSHHLQRVAYRWIFLIGSLWMWVLRIDYFMEGRAVFSYGPCNIVAYGLAFVYIVSTIVMAFIGSDHSSRVRRRAILVWQGSWLIAAVIQATHPTVLLAGFAAACGMFLLYAELENPHEGVDRMTGLYNVNALNRYIQDCYQNGREFASLQIRVEYLLQNVDLETEKTVMIRAANYLIQVKDAFPFRQSDYEFVLIFRNREDMDRGFEQIVSGIDAAIDMPVKLGYVLIPSSKMIFGADEFFRFQHYMSNKIEGMERVVVDEKTVSGMREYSRVKEMIQTALSDGRVEVFYQPFYNVKKDRFTACEALVRIRDLDGKIVPPGVFIPIAEENGLIVPLGIEIFRQVCAFLASGEPQKRGLEYIEVNLSVAQFDKENPADFVQNIIKEYNVDPSWINLEITETASTSAKQILLKNMYKLISNGIRFSLDDFGTGRSNLDYFVEMPVDIIKFDFSFTQGYFTSEKAKYVIESMVELMHRMNLAIVAEGVETREQLDTMCGLGVEYIQGYYFSKPIPRDRFLKFLEERNVTA